MCIITEPIENITNTRIIVSINNNLEQLTIYSNCINNSIENNYMILPVPNPDTLEFINIDSTSLNNLTQHQFYENEDIVHLKQYGNIKLYKSYNELFSSKESFLDIDQLKTNYSGKLWGFIVCELCIGNFQYMPLCYKHKMMVSHIYIPTKKCYSFNKINKGYNWNHVIYLLDSLPSILLSSLSSIRDYYTINNEDDFIIDGKYNLGKHINIDKNIINNKNSNLNIDLFNYYY